MRSHGTEVACAASWVSSLYSAFTSQRPEFDPADSASGALWRKRKDAKAQRRKGGEMKLLLPPSRESTGCSEPIKRFRSGVFLTSLRLCVFAPLR